MQALEDEELKPILVRSAEDLANILDSIKVPDNVVKGELGIIKFPLYLPFSSAIPIFSKEIKGLIYSFYEFSEGFSQQNYEIDDLLKKTLENVISATIYISYMDQMPTLSLSLAVQQVVNCKWLLSACQEFETLLLQHKIGTKGVKVTLQSRESFKEICSAAETRISKIIQAKIDHFVEMIEYDWSSTVVKKTYNPALAGNW
jgi:hypothetical protein